MEMCQASYDCQPHLYEQEIFQPLYSNPECLPRTCNFKDGEQPVLNEEAQRSIEPMVEAVDEVEKAF